MILGKNLCVKCNLQPFQSRLQLLKEWKEKKQQPSYWTVSKAWWIISTRRIIASRCLFILLVTLGAEIPSQNVFLLKMTTPKKDPTNSTQICQAFLNCCTLSPSRKNKGPICKKWLTKEHHKSNFLSANPLKIQCVHLFPPMTFL